MKEENKTKGKELLKQIICFMNREEYQDFITDRCIDDMLFVLENYMIPNKQLLMFKYKYGLTSDDTKAKTFEEVANRFNASYEFVKESHIQILHILQSIYLQSVKKSLKPKVLLKNITKKGEK